VCSSWCNTLPCSSLTAMWPYTGLLSERIACSIWQLLPVVVHLLQHLFPSLTTIQAHFLSARSWLPTGTSILVAASQI
jgi:hypothetical protein